jgi:hypothetical protein
MPHPKHAYHLLAVVSLCLIPVAVRADDSTSESNPSESAAPRLTSRVEPGEFIGEEQLRRVYVNAGTNQYGFIVPHGLRVDTSSSERLTLVEPSMAYFLTMQVTGSGTDALTQLRQRYPGAEVAEQTTTEAAGHRGTVFDLRWRNPEGVNRWVRAVFIPAGASTLQFDLISDQSRLNEAQLALSGLLQRLQSNETGRLQMEIGRMPDHS